MERKAREDAEREKRLAELEAQVAAERAEEKKRQAQAQARRAKEAEDERRRAERLERERARRRELNAWMKKNGREVLRDMIAELAKPGRDPRERFTPPRFREDVRGLEDLEPGMRLEGVVTNVVAFGAFVDVGVHQDGLVHVSQLADRYVADPREVVQVGDRLQVRVLEVDRERGRIALSARKDGGGGSPPARRG